MGAHQMRMDMKKKEKVTHNQTIVHPPMLGGLQESSLLLTMSIK
jgi:hypothetical protein